MENAEQVNNMFVKVGIASIIESVTQLDMYKSSILRYKNIETTIEEQKWVVDSYKNPTCLPLIPHLIGSINSIGVFNCFWNFIEFNLVIYIVQFLVMTKLNIKYEVIFRFISAIQWFTITGCLVSLENTKEISVTFEWLISCQDSCIMDILPDLFPLPPCNACELACSFPHATLPLPPHPPPDLIGAAPPNAADMWPAVRAQPHGRLVL